MQAQPIDREVLGQQERLLGFIMLGGDPAPLFAGLEKGDFIMPQHGDLFALIRKRHHKDMPIDYPTICDLLTGDEGDLLERLGGIPGLVELTALDAATLSAAQVADYIKNTQRDSGLRRLQRSTSLLTQALEVGDSDNLHRYMEPVLAQLEACRRQGGGRSGPELEPAAEVWQAGLAGIAEDAAGRGKPGLTFGIPQLDDALAPGLRPGRFLVVGAGTGEGKTVLAGMMALRAARSGCGVLFLSFEMGPAEILERVAIQEGTVPAWRLQKRMLRPFDLEALQEWKPPDGLMVPMASGLEARAFPSVVRRARAILGRPLGLVVVDHLQLVRLGGKTESRALEVKEAANVCKELALAGAGGPPLAVVALSQLNRQRDQDRPLLGNLKESGGVEEAADAVLLLSRKRDSEGHLTTAGRVHIAKHRGGKAGVSVAVQFDEERLTFR